MTPDELQSMRQAADPYVFGVAPSGVRPTDYVADGLPHAAPPAFTHPACRRVPVKSQQGGTCVGNSVALCMTYLEWAERGEVVAFDGEALNMRVVGRDYGAGAAASPHDVLEDVRLHGAAGPDGLYFPKAYAWVDGTQPDAVRAAMTAPGVMVTAAIWLQDNFGADGGKTYAPFHEENPWGLHEVTFVGYDADGVILQNSWGTWWGDSGFARLSWEYVTRRTAECWAITDSADTAKDGFVKTFDYGTSTTERAVRHTGSRPAVYLVKSNGRIWITDPWQAKRFGVDLSKVEQLPDTDPVWSLPVIGRDAPASAR